MKILLVTILFGGVLLPSIARGEVGMPPLLFRDDVPNDKGRVTAFKVIHDGIECDWRTRAGIGDTIRLGINGLSEWLETLQAKKIITSTLTGEELIKEQLPNLRLILGGHVLRTLSPNGYFFKDNPNWPIYQGEDNAQQKKLAADRLWINFTLARDCLNPDSREDWQKVLQTPGIWPLMTLETGIYDLKTNSAHILASRVTPGAYGSDLPFHLSRFDWDGWTILSAVLLMASLVLFLYLACRTGIVRDDSQPLREDGLPPYSLGRCQMAFWFFLTAWAFFFLWLVTGRGDINTINPTVLTLIGISAGTALGSAIITNNQTDPEARNQEPERNFPEEISAVRKEIRETPRTTWAKIRTIRAEQEALQSEARQASPDDPPDVALAQKIKDAEDRLNALHDPHETLKVLEAEYKKWRRDHRGQFFEDILSETGASGARQIITFHRFQIAMWTLVLGIIFASDVLTKLTMPNFDSTLLVLMGISSGTYLGFRLPTPAQR